MLYRGLLRCDARSINELVIRIGAHPGVLPETVSAGTDFEKNRWTPGIYDDVKLMVMSNPVIRLRRSWEAQAF